RRRTWLLHRPARVRQYRTCPPRLRPRAVANLTRALARPVPAWIRRSPVRWQKSPAVRPRAPPARRVTKRSSCGSETAPVPDRRPPIHPRSAEWPPVAGGIRAHVHVPPSLTQRSRRIPSVGLSAIRGPLARLRPPED